MTQRFNEFTFP